MVKRTQEERSELSWMMKFAGMSVDYGGDESVSDSDCVVSASTPGVKTATGVCAPGITPGAIALIVPSLLF